jgi:hypothetical protein
MRPRSSRRSALPAAASGTGCAPSRWSLSPPRSRSAEDAARAELERVAAERGLPISPLPLGVDEAGGTPLGTDALLQAAQRYGGDQIPVGRGEGCGADSVLQWTLYRRAASDSWSGPLAAGIDHTVDTLVPPQGGSLAQAEGVARVRIDGVTSLVDYANVERILQSVPGVRRANVVAAEPNTVVFEVAVRGGAAGLQQGLAGSTRLVVRSGAGAPPEYHYQPQG